MDKPFPAYRGDAPYVFVCYAHEDSDIVYPEIAWLREQGTNLWYDEGIAAGKNWRGAIGDSLLGASQVLFYITERSLKSDHCNREINLALDEGKDLVPIYLEDVELTSDLKVGLNRVQALHRDQSASYQQHLLNALGQTIEATPRPPSQKPTSPSSEQEATTSIPAIAVLPLVNIGDTEDYFSDGVTDEILNQMIRLRDVRVISRNSSFAYKDSALDIREIGKQLGADYILQGTVRRSANLVRIAVRLTDAADGTELWGSSYDRELTDILRIQDEIAQAAISEFVPNITVAPSAKPDINPVAYDLLLRARDAQRAMDPQTADRLLQAAIAIDGDFAEAHAVLAGLQLFLRAWGPPSYRGNNELLRVTNKALELDPKNVNLLATKARLDLDFESDLQGSISKLESLIRRVPNSVGALSTYSGVLQVADKRDEMLLVAKRLRELDPRSTVTAKIESTSYLAVGEFDRAFRALDRIPLDDPVGKGYWSSRKAHLVEAAIYAGHYDIAENNLKLLPEAPDKTYFLIWLAIERGQLDVARELYESTPKYISQMPWHWLPLDVVLTGEISRTLDELENLSNPGSIIWITLLPFWERWMSEFGTPVFKEAFAALRKEPRYRQALRKYGVDDESLAKIQVHTDELWD